MKEQQTIKGKRALTMAILKEYSSNPGCEVELTITLVNEGSVRFRIDLRFGTAFPTIHTEILCIKRDFFQLLEDLKQLDHRHLSMIEPHDPGLCIYHIPRYGPYFVPGRGILQLPEEEVEEPLYKLMFVLDAYERNNLGSRECGPALCLTVSRDQIYMFVNLLREEVMNFHGS